MAKKTIILVRHGQYIPKSEKEVERLTSLGREQARYVGKRLKENQKIHRIYHSSMPRAIETAGIIKRQLGYKGHFESCEHLRECVPGFPKNLRKKFGFTDEGRLIKDQAQAERAFKKYFKLQRSGDVTEVLVCHGNIIRYLICRLLQIDSLTWRQMDIQQCAISVVELRSKGFNKKTLISHNDVGHIPKAKRTFI